MEISLEGPSREGFAQASNVLVEHHFETRPHKLMHAIKERVQHRYGAVVHYELLLLRNACAQHDSYGCRLLNKHAANEPVHVPMQS